MRLCLPLALLIYATSCSLGCSDDPGPLGCVPGQVDSCPCLGESTGVQTCNEEGTAYGLCTCELIPPDGGATDVETPEDGIAFTEDATNPNDGDTSPDAGPDGEDQPDLDSPPSDDVDDEPPEEDVIAGPTILGCDEEEYPLPGGYANFYLTPENASLISDISDPATQAYALIGVTEAGNEISVDTALYTLQDPSLGVISSAGVFTATAGVGGETNVRAQWMGVCVEVHLEVFAVAHFITGDFTPDIVDLFPTELPPLGDTDEMEFLYPLDHAAWPANIAPMTVQWIYTLKWAESVFRVDIETEYALIHIYALGEDISLGSNEYALEIPEEAWGQIWAMEGGPTPHDVRIVALSGDGTQSLASVTHEVTFTDDEVGGAVYYWNNDMEPGNSVAGRIRMLAMDETEPVTVDVGGGCHGCHGVSPDGATVAITFQASQQSPIGESEGWSLALHNTEDGTPSAWIHEDAMAFLQGSHTLNPAFSKFYWTDTAKHMVVTQGGEKTPFTPPNETSTRHLYSVDLINGLVTQMTGVTDPDEGWHDMYPTFSSDGNFVVFMRTQTPGLFGADEESLLYRMPYNAGLGGDPVPLDGATDPDTLQYYPSLTPDDAYVVYNRVSADAGGDDECAAGVGPGKGGGFSTYNNCHSEMWIVPSDGGDATRLDNSTDPDGLGYTNSWPSVGPLSSTQYYWVSFSSYRRYGVLFNSMEAPGAIGAIGTKPKPSESAIPQLWITAIDPSKIGTGEDPSFAPIWLPHQDQAGGNHIGQWSVRVDEE